MALIGAPSRFSVLKMDVSDPMERKKPQAPKNNANQNNIQNSNKNNKQQQAKQSKKKKEANTNKKKQTNQSTSTDSHKFEEWKKRDEKLIEDQYEKELQEALLKSRLEQEKPDHRSRAASDNGDSKKKGKVTLSLQEFHQKYPDEDRPTSPVLRGEPLSKVLAQRKEHEEEEALRRQTQRDANAILAKEKIQREYLEKSSQPATVSQEEFDKMLDMKKKQIEHMAKVLNNTNKELAILQEQNADLERLLAKGEMKKKAELIKEVDDLRQVKDELTEQIQSLHAALEQERSKNHQLAQDSQQKRR